MSRDSGFIMRCWSRDYRGTGGNRQQRIDTAEGTKVFLAGGGRIAHYNMAGGVIGWTIQNPETGANEFLPITQATSAPSGTPSKRLTAPKGVRTSPSC